MKDLFLTPRGDLAIDNNVGSSNKLELNFITSYSNSLRINFFIEDTYQKTSDKNSLSINFNIDKPIYDKEIKMISGDKYIEQALRIRLETSLGTLRYNESIGSKLELVVHELVDEQKTMAKLKQYVREAIVDIVKDPVIEITKPKTMYLDYSNSLSIKIIDKDKQYNINL